MHRLLVIMIVAAAAVAICGCQKEIKEIRAPQHDRLMLASARL